MNLLGAALYDPAAAVSKATSALLAMTALDTTNLRLTVTVPAHGKLRFRMRGLVTGATTVPTILIGVMNGATVVGRVTPTYENAAASVATQAFVFDADFVVSGLTAGSTAFDAAYAVQVVVAATNIKYGGPNNATGANAWGAFTFEIWDPQPMQTNGQLVIDANGRVDVSKIAGTAQTALDLGGNWTATRAAKVDNLDAAISTRSVYAGGAVASVTGNVGGNVTGSVGSIATGGIVAGSIAATALNGKGDWNIGKTGYALSAAGIQAIWDALTSALTTVGSIGKLLATNIDALISSRSTYAGGAVASVTGAVGSVTGAVGSVTGNVGGNVVGSVGSVTGLTPGNLDVAVSTRLATASYTAPLTAAGERAALGLGSANLDTQLAAIAGYIDTEVGAVKAKTDQLNFTVAGQVDANALSGGGGLNAAGVRSALGMASANLDTQLDALPTNAELATALAGADDATLAAIAALPNNTTAITAIKAKTDGLTFTTPGEVDAHIRSVNSVPVTGSGTDGDPWGS